MITRFKIFEKHEELKVGDFLKVDSLIGDVKIEYIL